MYAHEGVRQSEDWMHVHHGWKLSEEVAPMHGQKNKKEDILFVGVDCALLSNNKSYIQIRPLVDNKYTRVLHHLKTTNRTELNMRVLRPACITDAAARRNLFLLLARMLNVW